MNHNLLCFCILGNIYYSKCTQSYLSTTLYFLRLLDFLIPSWLRAVRTISHAARYDHTHELFINLKLLKLKYISMYFSSLLIFKFLNNNYVPSVFTRDYNPYGLRNINNVHVPHSRSELFLRSVYYKAPSIWYNLDVHLKQIRNINTFKSKLKEYLFALQI